MKRIALVLLLASVAGAEGPYEVIRSTQNPNLYHIEFISHGEPPDPYLYRGKLSLSCEKGIRSECEWIFDLAEALNAAHERRAKRK